MAPFSCVFFSPTSRPRTLYAVRAVPIDREDRMDSTRVFAPRDNVVYETGYFAGALTRERTRIIREAGAKVPTVFGGAK